MSTGTPTPPSGPGGNSRVRVFPAGPGVMGGNEAMSAVLAQNWWALAIRGVAAILIGLIALVSPGAVLLTFALFLGAYLLVDGVFGIVSAVRAAQRHERWGLLLAEGVLSAVTGLAAFLFPVGAVLAFVFLNAAWSLITGGLMVAAAFQLTPAHGRWWMALAGVASILFGIILVLSPLVGAVVLTWWFGGYAIAFGAFLLVLALKLRGQKDEGTTNGTTTGTPVQRGT